MGHPHDDAMRMDGARLKALSHPLRVGILDQLITNGPATATALAERIGESTGLLSYHLRQLERHGIIGEDSERGSGRERWWKVLPGGLSISPADVADDPVALAATQSLAAQITDSRSRHLDTFVRSGIAAFGVEWVESSEIMSAVVSMTREELEAARAEVDAALMEVVTRYKGKTPSPGAKRVLLQFNAFPVVGAPDPSSEEPR